MITISGTTMKGAKKNSDGYWILVEAPTAGMTLDTSASLYAPGCICINTGDAKTYTNSGTTASPSWQNVNEIATTEIADAAVTPLKTTVVYAAVASPGATGSTSTISETATFVTVSSAAADANSIIVLPSAYAGRKLSIAVGATGVELRTPSTTTVAINGGTGSAAESALAANSYAVLEAVSTTNWKGSYITATAAAVGIEAAAN